ncbi:MAG: 2-oxo acid dehydrogenase subunit E2 [Bacteroidetes bacterium]|nr:2-oxo acid dehydrogenase subunit E2 [Bacteroidota bacterium]
MAEYKIQKFPKSRIGTLDIGDMGRRKHSVVAMIEMDVTESRAKIKSYKKEVSQISFTAWLIKAISLTIKQHSSVAAYLKGKRRIVIFNDINISMVFEKSLDGHKIPIPLIIEKANERSIESITAQISEARAQEFTRNQVVLQSKPTMMEQIYYFLPGCMRRCMWKYLLSKPKMSFGKMGNVAVTSVGMMGQVNGWFIPISVHPICFGIGSVIKKPQVVNDKIVIREMLNMTILIDHDVIDGAPMARFISDLSKNIHAGIGI